MHYTLTYYPWITQHKDPKEIHSNIVLFAAEVEKELQHTSQDSKIVVADALEVPDQITSIVKGQSHIALMNPLGFAYARQQQPRIDAAAVALRIIDGKVGDSYFAQIYTHVDSQIKTLGELRKKSIGYGSSQSTSNFIIPAYDLKHAGIHPFAAFSKVIFAGGHDKAAVAVYEKAVDAGAGHDGVIIDLSTNPKYSDAKEKLVTLHRSKPIPSDPIALHVQDQQQYISIQSAMVAVSQRSPAKEAISEFWGKAQGLKETTYQPYEYLVEAVKELGLTQEDIFG